MSKLVAFSIAILLFSCQGTSKKSLPSTIPDTTGTTVTAEIKDLVQSDSHSFKVEIEKITAAQLDSAMAYAKPKQPIVKITDFEVVQKKLSGIVDFRVEDGYLGIKRINFRNGTNSGDKEEFEEYAFVAYFPDEDILLCEGGHTTDISFDLGTGQETYEVGNPDLATISPNGKYRLNKVFEGQECFFHFIQKKEQNKFRKVLDLSEAFEKKTNKWLCVTGKEFWTDDVTLYLGLVTQYKEDGNEYDYYKIKIIDR